LLAQHEPYWNRTAAQLFEALGACDHGLSGSEAAARLQRDGANHVDDAPRLAALRLLLAQFESPLVLILVFGAAISLILQDWIEAIIILTIVLGSALLGFTQEYRASAAVAELRRRLALTVRVRRAGEVQTVAATALVPGDVILLSAGNLVPADGLVLAATDFLVSEATLTGESFPVEKQPDVLPPDTPIARRTNCVFLGTSVRSGTADVLVVHTGGHTAFGAIAERLRARAPETEFARGVRQFGYLLARVMIVMVLFVVSVNQLLGRPVFESLLFAVALAVGLSPELLPAIVSVTLSRGARAMARRGVIVRRLEAIENLGSMDVLCTDKTGTLTEGVIALDATLDADGHASAEVQRLAYLNAAFETGIANPLDAAIIAAADRQGFSAEGYRKVDEIPYDFMRKRLTIVVAAADDPEHHLIISKGAFTNILAVCSTVRRSATEIALDDREREGLEDFFRRQGNAGFRVIAVAVKKVAARAHYEHGDEAAMSLVGFLLFFDPLKADVQSVIGNLAQVGIRIKIITGDNRHVAAHVARGIGLDGAALLTGEDIARLKDEALWQRAERADLFVEVDPQQKERIVRALQRMGHAVGYLGDGINDAPALHAADVGISVDQAVDVARESADVILLRRDLEVLRRGVEDGRRTFANTLKYIAITTSANFGNMVSMALVTPLLPFLPLAAKQILLNNFLSDLPSIAISTDNVDAERTAQAQRWHVGDVRRFMIVFGFISTVFDLITFTVLLKAFGADQATFQTAWFVVSLLTELAVVLVLRTQRSALASMPSHVLLWSTAAVCAIAVVAPYVRPFAAVFGFVPLAWPLLAVMLVIVMGYVVTTEVTKLRFNKPPTAVSAHGGAASSGGRSVAAASRMRSVSAAGR
jgi:Mg2+-importing ATPase